MKKENVLLAAEVVKQIKQKMDSVSLDESNGQLILKLWFEKIEE